jgi:membrane protease YdiL (CAAX protease family)
MRTRSLLPLYALAVLPFFLNDIGFILATTAPEWLGVDYASKLAALSLILAIPVLRRLARDWGETAAPVWLLALPAIASAGLIVAEFRGFEDRINALWPESILYRFPRIESDGLRIFDLTAGLALTAVVEELVFRRLFADVVGPLFRSEWGMVAASAILFGAIHWSAGIGSVVCATLAGVVLMVLMRRSGSLWPPVVAHYLTNLILFT